jgi:signal peptidase I
MATALFLGTFFLVLVLSVGANAVFLYIGARWAKIPNATFGRAACASVVVAIANWIALALLNRGPAAGLEKAILIMAVVVVLSLGLTWLTIALVLSTSMWRAIIAWLPTLIPAACLLAIAAFVVRPYLFEVFTCPTNSMAPTIVGRHWEAPCPRCGSPAYGTPEDGRLDTANRPVLMICSRERRSCEVANPPHTEHAGDRFIVSKFLRPRRWDVIIFRLPEDPKILFCKRLMGLPGETVTIRDGAVWIDGTKQTPPPPCQGLEYLDRFQGYSPQFWGSEERPAKLGADEYFVLGDFSARAKDSRLWEKGAPGHPPYAVPASYIVGVVTHIYWPPERCRALR